MATTRKAKFDYFLKGIRTKRHLKDGTSALILKMYLNGKEKWHNTKIYLLNNQWDTRRQQVKNHPLANKYNGDLRNLLTKIDDYQLYLLRKGVPITLERLAEFQKDDQNITFTEFYQQQLDVVASTLAKGTHKSHRTVFKRLCEFRRRIYFSDLDYKFIQQYGKFLRDYRYSTNGAAKHHRVLKRYINQAIFCGHLKEGDNPYRQFRREKINNLPT